MKRSALMGTGGLGTGDYACLQAPSPHVPTSLPQIDDESRAPVQTTRFFARVVVLRPLLTVAHGPQTILRNSAAYEVVLHSRRASVAEREVVLRRADAAGMPFDF